MLFVFLLTVLVLGIFFLCISTSNNILYLRKIALATSIIVFYLSLFLWIFFDKTSLFFQYLTFFQWFSFFNISFLLGIDGLSLFFVILTTFLMPICILSSWKVIKTNVKEFFILFLFLELLLILVFTVLDLMLFYIFFESVLIPMFLIIGIWGSRERKIKASYFFFIYTLFGSLIMLMGLLLILFDTGTTNLIILLTHKFSYDRQLLLWIMFFASFIVKIPSIPVHIWLPEAHVEAPTVGSVILAGLLLKLGTYGLLRFSFPLFPEGTQYFTPLVYTIALISVVYSSLTTIRQIDLKRIIAYSSVAHMNFSLFGLFSNTIQGIEGGIILMISHGFVASALFLIIGILYDRYHTRLLKYYSGLTTVMPIFSILFLFFSLSNLGLPGTSSFVGEMLILVGITQHNLFVAVLSGAGIILGSIYSIWLYNRICFGNLKIQYNTNYIDVTKREFYTVLPLLLLTLAMGIYPKIFFDNIYNVTLLLLYY